MSAAQQILDSGRAQLQARQEAWQRQQQWYADQHKKMWDQHDAWDDDKENVRQMIGKAGRKNDKYSGRPGVMKRKTQVLSAAQRAGFTTPTAQGGSGYVPGGTTVVNNIPQSYTRPNRRVM